MKKNEQGRVVDSSSVDISANHLIPGSYNI